MLMAKKRIISVGLIVPRVAANGDVEVLLQFKRKYNEWEFPGGKLDGIEPTHICGRRELYEEVNIVAEELEFVTYVDHGNKYCCLMFIVRNGTGDATVAEPDKQSVVGWFPLYELPKPLTRATAASIKAGALRPLYDEAGLTADDVEPQIGD
jgi:8-oxo-dGTP diphosphatase